MFKNITIYLDWRKVIVHSIYVKHCFCESHYWQRRCMIDALNYSLPKLTEPKLKETFQISFSKILKNKRVSRKSTYVLSNGHTIGFRPQCWKLQVPYMHCDFIMHSRLWVDSGIERVKMNLILSNTTQCREKQTLTMSYPMNWRNLWTRRYATSLWDTYTEDLVER